MKQCMDAENLHRRLKKIIGQVQAIDRMVDEDVPARTFFLRSMLQSRPCIRRTGGAGGAYPALCERWDRARRRRADDPEFYQGGGTVFQYGLM